MRNMMCARRDDGGGGDDNDDSVQVNGIYFLGMDMYNYSALRAGFTGMCGPQNSTYTVTDIADTFELLSDKNQV
jgi:hypothetical protein